VVGERQQDTLEPVLTTPIPQEEFLVGKALAALVPSLVIAYAVYGFVLVAVWLFARPGIASALLQGPALLAQLVFTPLLAAWSIWVAIAISTRASDVRVAQQLGMLACLPSVAVTMMLAYEVIPPTPGLAVGLFVLLVALDLSGWRFVSAMFDRERLVTGAR
jgi:ABC-2 type transport system permease protein